MKSYLLVGLLMVTAIPAFGDEPLCPEGGKPVCATDGSERLLFENECQLNVFNYKQLFAHKKSFRKTDLITCIANCDSLICPFIFAPVCAKNEETEETRTVPNACLVNNLICETKQPWTVIADSPCDEVDPQETSYAASPANREASPTSVVQNKADASNPANSFNGQTEVRPGPSSHTSSCASSNSQTEGLPGPNIHIKAVASNPQNSASSSYLRSNIQTQGGSGPSASTQSQTAGLPGPNIHIKAVPSSPQSSTSSSYFRSNGQTQGGSGPSASPHSQTAELPAPNVLPLDRCGLITCSLNRAPVCAQNLETGETRTIRNECFIKYLNCVTNQPWVIIANSPCDEINAEEPSLTANFAQTQSGQATSSRLPSNSQTEGLPAPNVHMNQATTVQRETYTSNSSKQTSSQTTSGNVASPVASQVSTAQRESTCSSGINNQPLSNNGQIQPELVSPVIASNSAQTSQLSPSNGRGHVVAGHRSLPPYPRRPTTSDNQPLSNNGQVQPSFVTNVVPPPCPNGPPCHSPNDNGQSPPILPPYQSGPSSSDNQPLSNNGQIQPEIVSNVQNSALRFPPWRSPLSHMQPRPSGESEPSFVNNHVPPPCPNGQSPPILPPYQSGPPSSDNQPLSNNGQIQPEIVSNVQKSTLLFPPWRSPLSHMQPRPSGESEPSFVNNHVPPPCSNGQSPPILPPYQNGPSSSDNQPLSNNGQSQPEVRPPFPATNSQSQSSGEQPQPCSATNINQPLSNIPSSKILPPYEDAPGAQAINSPNSQTISTSNLLEGWQTASEPQQISYLPSLSIVGPASAPPGAQLPENGQIRKQVSVVQAARLRRPSYARHMQGSRRTQASNNVVSLSIDDEVQQPVPADTQSSGAHGNRAPVASENATPCSGQQLSAQLTSVQSSTTDNEGSGESQGVPANQISSPKQVSSARPNPGYENEGHGPQASSGEQPQSSSRPVYPVEPEGLTDVAAPVPIDSPTPWGASAAGSAGQWPVYSPVFTAPIYHKPSFTHISLGPNAGGEPQTQGQDDTVIQLTPNSAQMNFILEKLSALQSAYDKKKL